jgi:hypothetical protein
MPWLFADEQEQRCVFVCQKRLNAVRNDQNFLSRVINRRRNLDLLLQPRNKTGVLSVEKSVLSIPEESDASWIEYARNG